MSNKIDELHIKIGTAFDSMIPAEYKDAFIFYEGGTGIMTTFWFCYIDAVTGAIIPADGLTRRKDIIIHDINSYDKLESQIMLNLRELQKRYLTEYEKEWHTLTYHISQNGAFNIELNYEEPTGSLQERRDKWCMEHIGMIPRVTVDMLRN